MSSADISRPADGVVQLTINNMAKRNALDLHLCRALREAVVGISADPSVRVLVVTGAGSDAFCAGADLPDIFGALPPDISGIRSRLKEVYEGFLGLRRLSIPVIAAVKGPAVGAGFNVALCSDIVFAAPNASFDVTFTRLGLHPGGGCTSFLVQAVGRQRAMQLILEGGRLSAQSAADWGLIAAVVDDPVVSANSLATHIAQLDRSLVADIKSAIQIADSGDFSATLEFESWAQAASSGSEALRKAIERLT